MGTRRHETRALADWTEVESTASHAAVAVSEVARGGLIWVGVSAVLFRLRRREAVLDGVVAWLTADAMAWIAKRVVGRRRPQLAGRGFAPTSSSMPSSHAAASVAYAVAAGIAEPALAAPLGAIATAVSWSRVQTRRHFPSDVLAGAAIGTAAAIATRRGLRTVNRVVR